MKRKIFASLFFIFIIVITLTVFSTKYITDTILKEKIEELSSHRRVEFNVMLQKQKAFLASLGEFFSKSEIVKKAYISNNPLILKKEFAPLYLALLKRNFIEEIHFFKKNVNNFISFSTFDINKYNIQSIRKDLELVEKTLKPSYHFFICKHFPGLRAVYPILYKKRLIGTVSLGTNIIVFKEIFEQLGANASIYLKENLLMDSLEPKVLNQYFKFNHFNNYIVIGETFKINLNKQYLLKDNILYTIIPITDFFKNKIGFVVIKDDLREYVNTLNKNTIFSILIQIISFSAIFFIIYFLFKYIFKKLEEFKSILELIKKQQFNKIPPPTDKITNEFDEYKNTLIEVANELRLYINILTKKLNDYSIKAYQDGLTKIFNRTFLEEKHKEIFLKYKLSKTPLGVIMLDIDDFKKINDTYGHDVGDFVLVTLAKNIKSILRKNDIFIRYGGEEFLILLDDTEIEDAYKIAEKIRESIEKLKIVLPNEDEIQITISLGVTILQEDDTSLFDAIKRADENLYKAKKTGKNRVIV